MYAARLDGVPEPPLSLLASSIKGLPVVELLLERRASLEPKVPLPPLLIPSFLQASQRECRGVDVRHRMDQEPV